MSFAACLLTGELPRRAGEHVRDDLEHLACVDPGLIRGRPRFTVAFVLVMSRGTLTRVQAVSSYRVGERGFRHQRVDCLREEPAWTPKSSWAAGQGPP